jgi:hypothetical protein
LIGDPGRALSGLTTRTAMRTQGCALGYHSAALQAS